MKQLHPLVRVREVNALQPLVVRVEFENGTVNQINLDRYLHGPVFEEIRNSSALFAQVTIEGGTLAWPNGADIDPDVLYYDLEPAWLTELESV